MKVLSARTLLLTTTLMGVILFNGVVSFASSAAIIAGKIATLSATADGSAPFTYQWYKDGSVLIGATNSSYVLNNFQAADVGTYSAVVSNSAGSATSDNAVLSLAVVTVIPAFTTQPVSQSVTAGNAVTLTAAASGSPAPSFQWQKDGVNISGATSTSYTDSSTAVGDAGSYTVIATNSVGAVTSTAAILTVNIPTSPPVITTQPLSQTVTTGNAVSFTAAASGLPTPTYQWKINGTAISGATNSSYTLSSTALSDAGSYTVVATNSVSAVTSNTATLTVNAAPVAPTITTQPAAQTATAGSTATFTVTASGTPAPTYQWRKNGATISGATSASYALANVSIANAATYTVIVTNSAGSVTSNGALLTINISPAFTTQPVSQTALANASVTFSAAANGTPAPVFQWKKGGTDITGATSASYTISSAVAGDAGSYTVVATNSVGSTPSNSAVLTINSAPSFTIQPGSQTALAGGSVTFIASASGSPTPTFQWKKGGAALTGATNATYTISSLVAGNAGSYTVVATNSISSTTSNTATLIVNAAPASPVFTTQPASQSAVAGAIVTFTATVSGTPTPTFQWRKDGVNIPGATGASFIIASATPADAASYTVVASNTGSTVTSNAAVLSVLTAPTNVVISVTVM